MDRRGPRRKSKTEQRPNSSSETAPPQRQGIRGRRPRGRGRGGRENGAGRGRTPPTKEKCQEAVNDRPRPSHSSYWSEEETQEKLLLGQCFEGVYRTNAKGGGEGYVSLPDCSQDVMFRKGSFQNRAIAGDTIAFRILPTKYWWIQKSTPQKNVEQIPVCSDAELMMMDGLGRRMGLLLKSIHNIMTERGRQQNLPRNLQQRINLPVFWDHAESPEEARKLVETVTEYFPEIRPTAEVVRILKDSPKRSAVVGVLRTDPETRSALYLFPLETTLPKRFIVVPDSLTQDQQFLVEEASNEEIDSRTLVRAVLSHWEKEQELPTAIVHEIIGPTGDIEVETSAILNSHRVEEKPFGEEALKCLPSDDWELTEDDFQDRWDFRKSRIFSIDPPTARDLDDAVSVERLDNGLFKVGVHIADVSHFVKPGDALDEEARSRTTSVYLVQRVIPMLPELLSSHLCSLQPGEDRLTFSVVWEMNLSGQIFRQDVKKSVIHSCAKLAYANAQTAIEDPSAPIPENLAIHGDHTWEQIREDILTLFKISQSLREKRHESGALRLDLPKICFRLDEKGLPEEAEAECQVEANHLIQEYMLLANMTVAKIISDTYPAHALLRLHPPPNLKLMKELEDVAGELKVDLDIGTAAAIQRGMWELSEKCKDPHVMHAIINMATRGMNLAEYFCTGRKSEKEWAHYALATDFYTHFTSPIRRYPDIVVHRLLYAAITVGRDFEDKLGHEDTLNMQKIAALCNTGKLSARNAQDASLNLYLKHWLLKEPVLTLAVVASVRGPKFFDIYVPQFSISKRLLCEELAEGIMADFDQEACVLTIQKLQMQGERKEDHEKNSQNEITPQSQEELPEVKREELPGQEIQITSAPEGHKDIPQPETASKGSSSPRHEEESVCIELDLIYHEDGVSINIRPAKTKEESLGRGRHVRVEFAFVSDKISVDLHSEGWKPRSRGHQPSKNNSRDKAAREISTAAKQESEEMLREGDVKTETNGMTPLRYPLRLSRFSKIPVKVWVQRDKIFGLITDIQIDLVTTDV